ncbi:MAG: glycosyltransferase [Calditrichia bacterium]
MVWFMPRLLSILSISSDPIAQGILGFFIVFVLVAWLYGFFNIGVIVFALINKYFLPPEPTLPAINKDAFEPPIALLYTTCNDFVEASVESCVRQDYKNYTVYLLDDSSSVEYKQKVDAFASRHSNVRVIRRTDRKGFKAGNLNNALQQLDEPYFAIADADEILPPDFLSKTVPYMEADSSIGFVQANHKCNPAADSPLAKAMGIGIDIHWRWYQPLRNRFGFVMFLGHGAVLRKECWTAMGGFPEIVSEDLAFAIRARELGWRGYFAKEVVCYEDFPEDIRSFRVRHMKWTRGTCEFLRYESGRLLKSRTITWQEKFDILFPTLNLPLTLFYFLFMINTNLLFPWYFGIEKDVTIALAGSEWVLPIYVLDPGFNVLLTADFFILTTLTLFAPVLCFLLDMYRQPVRLAKFLTHSTAVYATLGPLSSVGVLSYMLTGKATFLVTGDKSENVEKSSLPPFKDRFRTGVKEFFYRSHPDQKPVQLFEVACGILFGIVCLKLMQISFLGLAFGFALMPLLHRSSWLNPFIQTAVIVPFLLVLVGVSLSGLALMGIPTMFFSFGFHF